MTWTSLLDHWPSMVHEMAKRFPHIDAWALQRFRGKRDIFEVYLAETHDLTLREASQSLEDWMHFSAPKYKKRLAA